MPEPGEIVYSTDGSVTIGAPAAKVEITTTTTKKEN